MTYSYVDLKAFKSGGALTGTGDDTRLRALLENVTRQVDGYLNRHFFELTATRYFDGTGKRYLNVPDLVAVTTLKEDEDLDATYETTWAATDYVLAPYEADPATAGNPLSLPYYRIEVDVRSTGSKSAFGRGQRRFELAARWGYWRHLRRATETATVANATTTTLTASAATDVQVGHTLLVESEQLYVEAISGTTYTVRRGVNGTTAAAHTAGSAIDFYEYPGPVVEAVLMQALRLWTRRASGFANQVGFADTGQLSPVAGLDRDVRQLLDPYRLPVAV